jgi:hypothetical protein
VRLQFGMAPGVSHALEVSGILDRIESMSTREEALQES